MSVLFCLSIVVSFTRMGCHRQCQYCPGPWRTKDGYLARQNMLFSFFSSVGRNSIAHGLKRCVHFEVRLIMVFICSLSTIIYFVHRKESGKLVLLVFAPLAAININIIIQTWPSNWTFKMQNKLRILFILKQFKYISIKNNILFDSYRSSMSCNLRLFVCLSDWILNSWFKFQFFFSLILIKMETSLNFTSLEKYFVSPFMLYHKTI